MSEETLTPPAKQYAYDIALSFAGEDRLYADALAEALRLRGLTIFYDKYEKSTLWGKNLYTYLSDIYQNKAHYCVMFLSRHYATKLWTNHEREAAQARAFKEQGVYILPVRLDSTEVPGILSTVAHLSWPPETAETIADTIVTKLGKASQTSIPAISSQTETSPISSSQLPITVQTDAPSMPQKTKEQWLTEGDVLTELERYEEALAAYEQAIRLNPKDLEIYSNKGYVLDELERYEEALAAYEQAIRLNPKSVRAYTNCGNVLSHLERYEEALAAFKHAIQLNPNSAVAYNGMGYVLDELERYEEALAAYEQAIQLDPGDAMFHSNKGKVLRELERYEEALAAHEQAIRLNPDSASAHYNMGNALYKLKRYTEALAAYEQAIRLNPDDANIYYNKGRTLKLLGRSEEARRTYEKALQLGYSG